MLVVAAAVLRDGCVLAGRRRTGGWEFPGGKVEPGETPAAALVRECAEELGVRVEVERQLGTAYDGDLELQLWRVALTDGEPSAYDHAELRWVDAGGLDSLGWLPIDRELLPAVRPLLGG